MKNIVRTVVIFQLLEKVVCYARRGNIPLVRAPETPKNDKIVPIVLMWAFRTALNEWKVGHSAKSADSDWIHYPISLYITWSAKVS
jgi:hypothetical protein